MVTVRRCAIETMLENGYKPTRTVVLAFGFDEESGGVHVGLVYSVCILSDK